MLRTAIEGIMARGNAELGDKTLLDALAPMTDTIEANRRAAGDASDAMVAAAASAARAPPTPPSPMQARRGRASYTGERSIGSVDPGAIAVAVIAGAPRRRPGPTARRPPDVRAPGATRQHPRPSHDDVEREMKKFVNDPLKFVPEMLKGIALANPDTLRVRARVQPDHAGRRSARRQGLDHPGLRARVTSPPT